MVLKAAFHSFLMKFDIILSTLEVAEVLEEGN